MICVYICQRYNTDLCIDKKDWGEPKNNSEISFYAKDDNGEHLLSIILEQKDLGKEMKGVLEKANTADNKQSLCESIVCFKEWVKKLISLVDSGRDVSGEEISVFVHNGSGKFRDINANLFKAIDLMRELKFHLLAITCGEGKSYNPALIQVNGRITPPLTVAGVREVLKELYKHQDQEYQVPVEELSSKHMGKTDSYSVTSTTERPSPSEPSATSESPIRNDANKEPIEIKLPSDKNYALSMKALQWVSAAFVGVVILVLVAGSVLSWRLAYKTPITPGMVALSILAFGFSIVLLAVFYVLYRIWKSQMVLRSRVLSEFISQLNNCKDDGKLQRKYRQQYLDELIRIWRGKALED